MSNPISEDCSSGLHEYCTPCECTCHENKLHMIDEQQLALEIVALLNSWVEGNETELMEKLAKWFNTESDNFEIKPNEYETKWMIKLKRSEK